MAPDRGLGGVAVAVPELLRAAHVVRDRGQDGDPAVDQLVDERQDRLRVRWQQRIDQEGVRICPHREARHLGPELTRMPFGVTGGPAPEVVAQLLGSLSHARQLNLRSTFAGYSAQNSSLYAGSASTIQISRTRPSTTRVRKAAKLCRVFPSRSARTSTIVRARSESTATT